MSKSKEKHLQARKQLGLFLKQRREEMGYSCKSLADFIGISENTMNWIEQGLFDYGVMQLFKICEALEIKPYFVPFEMDQLFTDKVFGTNLN